MRAMRGLLALAALVSFAGCGGPDDETFDADAQSLDTGRACSTDDLAWPAERPPAERQCDGPWTYRPYASPCYANLPNGPACGYEQTTCTSYNTCSHPDFGVLTYGSVTFSNTSTREVCEDFRECCYYPVCFKPYCETWTDCWDESYCTEDPVVVKNREIAKYPAQYQAAIRATITGCTVKLDNVPTAYKSGTGPVCGIASQWTCDDLSRPKTCRTATNGLDPDLGACGLVPDTAASYLYTAPGRTLASLQNDPEAAVRARATDSRYPALRCTTGQDLPAGTAAEVQAKHAYLRTQWSNGYALAQDPALRAKVSGWLKLLFETKGDLLTPTQRSDTVWWYQSLPDERPQCGTYWDPPAEGPSLLQTFGFENATTPLTGWSSSGTTAGVSAARTGAFAAMVGSSSGPTSLSQLARAFHVSSVDPGHFTFWYRASCTDAFSGAGASVTLYDNSTRVTHTLLAPTCTASGAWTQVSVSLAPFAGHTISVYLRNVDDNSAATAPTYTLYDDVVVSYYPREMASLLVMCDRLAQGHAAREVAELYGDTCVDRAAGPRSLPATYPSRQGLLDGYTNIVPRELGKAFGALPATAATQADRVTALRARLRTVQRWYSAARTGVYADAARFWEDGYRITRGVTQGAHARAAADLQAATGATGPDMAAVLGEHLAAGFRADRELLYAAYPEAAPTPIAPPLTGALLLLLTDDALAPLTARLDEADAYHDLACRYRGCAGTGSASELAQLHDLAATVHAKADLDGALAAATAVRRDPLGDDWVTAFQRVSGNHGAFQSALRDALGYASTVPYDAAWLDAAFSGAPQPVLSLASTVRGQARRSDNFRRSGLFTQPSNAYMMVGLQKSKIDAIDAEVRARIAALDTAISTYESGRRALVQDLLAQYRNEREEQSVSDRIMIQAKAFEDQSKDLAGLRLNAELDQAKLGDVGKAYQAAADRIRSDPALSRFHVQPLAPDTFTVSAADARFTTVSNHVSQVAVLSGAAPRRIAAGAGDVLNFQISGSWSPSCAVRSTATLPDGRALRIPSPTTGPQGYELQYTNGAYDAVSHQVSDEASIFSSHTDSRRVCAGAKVSVGGGWGPFSAEAYATAEACSQSEWGNRSSHTTSDSRSNGSEARNSAAFSYGLRLRDTPFPEYPAGALLLVRTAPGLADPRLSKPELLDVQVLQAPSTTVPITEASDVFLVVNDLATCASPDPAALTVTLTRIQPAGDLVVALGAAMATAHETLRASATSLLSQGRVLPHDLEALRSAAYGQLEFDCGCDLSLYPAAMRGFFDAFVAAELARVEREVEIRALERQMETALLELEAMRRDLAAVKEESRLVRLTPLWAIRSVDADQLRSAARDLATVVRDWLYPMVHLRYPEALVLLENDTATRDVLTSLVHVDWSAPATDAARAARNAADGILSKVRLASGQSPVTGFLYPVAVSFDNPYYAQPPLQAPPTNGYKRADGSRARALWDQLRLRGEARIELRPEDFFDLNGGPAQLVCTKAAPIVNSVALYVARKGTAVDGINAQHWSVPVTIAPEMTFVAPEGPATYEFTGPAWLSDQVRILGGEADYAIDRFHQYAAPTPVLPGLSPFSSFLVDVQALSSLPFNPFDTATYALIVVMDVDPRSIQAPGATWIESCRP